MLRDHCNADENYSTAPSVIPASPAKNRSGRPYCCCCCYMTICSSMAVAMLVAVDAVEGKGATFIAGYS